MSTPLRRVVRRLSFEIGDNTYEVPPVDDDRGTKLAGLISRAPAEASKLKVTTDDLFKLAMSPELWQRMRTDGVGFVDLRCAGLAALVHFQVLLHDPNPSEALEHAERAARSVWEAGVNPEALAATMAALPTTSSPTKPSTRSAAASTTRSPASGTGTRTRQPAKKTKAASRSRGSNSPRNAR